jgi:hypothetical protein
MIRRLDLLAAATALVLATPAAAGGCCVMPYSNCPCSPVIVPEPFDTMGSGIYIVDQGPVFSGPGPALPRQVRVAAPTVYPYVGHVFTGYPYGVANSGGYPRGSYSPFAGYPYVDPPPGLNAPSYVKYRMGHRPMRYHRRAR